jgi:hypothetical protein
MSKLSYENWPRWFASIWPDQQRRWTIINGYRAFGANHPTVLADIALRNNVFAPIRENDAHKAAIAEGRRQCALEIFKLANVDPVTLFGLTQVDRKLGEKR